MDNSIVAIIVERYDVIIVLVDSFPVFAWLDSLNWFKWDAIQSLSPICNPNFSFMGGVGKKKNLLNFKLGYEKYFAHILSVGGDALKAHWQMGFHLIHFSEMFNFMNN